MKKIFWYKEPQHMTLDGWDEWEQQTRKNYPFQFFFRESLPCFFRCKWARFCDLKYSIQCFFFPKHREIRKAIPRTWADISSLVVDVNFAMILSFKKEADESCVDWDGSPEHRQFKNWLDSSYHWITVGRPNCEAQRDKLYPPHPLPLEMKGFTYDQLYGSLNKIEQLIDETNTTILKQMIEYREYMWT
jgi:hypothetical protein